MNNAIYGSNDENVIDPEKESCDLVPGEDYEVASGAMKCPYCPRPYSAHRPADSYLRHGLPWLRAMCDGSLAFLRDTCASCGEKIDPVEVQTRTYPETERLCAGCHGRLEKRQCDLEEMART